MRFDILVVYSNIIIDNHSEWYNTTAYFQTTATAVIPNGIHSNVGLGGSNLFLSSMNKPLHSNINGKYNGNIPKNGVHRHSDNEHAAQYFSSSEEAHSGYLNYELLMLFDIIYVLKIISII